MTFPALYLITPPVLPDPHAFAAALEEALDAAGPAGVEIACVQLRLKGASDDAVLAAAAALQPSCRRHGAALLINDRADLAARAGVDGVHLGQDDGSVAEARALLGEDADIGVTCHDSRHLAMEAGEAGADYVAFGAFFPTRTKEVRHRPDPDILTAWSEMTTLPCVAIGGITPANCQVLAAAGADYLAVSSAVWDGPEGPAGAIAAFGRALHAGGASS
jgi:thiamine-phosphate pyrophosphorylase